MERNSRRQGRARRVQARRGAAGRKRVVRQQEVPPSPRMKEEARPMQFVVAESTYEVIPENVYNAELKNIEERKNDNGSYLLWRFEVQGKKKTAEVVGSTSLVMSVKSKAYTWSCALLGQTPPPGTAFGTEDLIGNRCRLVVKIQKRDDGTERNQIAEVLPIDVAPDEAF